MQDTTGLYEQITVQLAGVLHPSLPIMAAKGRELPFEGMVIVRRK